MTMQPHSDLLAFVLSKKLYMAVNTVVSELDRLKQRMTCKHAKE